jgi:glycosyltransferase involved in cell wall biosynthesis
MRSVMAEQQPQVSVVLPMRNAAHTIDPCLQSIVKQTYPHFEVVIVDDGSTDDSLIKVTLWSQRDRRIRLLRQSALGLVAALNKALSLAKGQFIARMDADDIMHPGRLQAQVAFLNTHPDIHLVATQVEVFPNHRVTPGYQEYIRWQNQCLTPQDMWDEIYVESPIAHPSVMLRREVFVELGGYHQGDFPEDYELWLRMLSRNMCLAKIPQVLLKWRDSGYRCSRVDSRYHKQKFDNLRAWYLARDPRINTSRPLVLWGAGRKTRKRVALLGIKPALWLDVDSKKIGKTYMDAAVVNYTWLRDSNGAAVKPFVLSYVTNHGVREQIANELGECGFERGKDYLMVG